MVFSRLQATGIYRRFVIIFALSIVGFILAGICLVWAGGSYSTAEAKVEATNAALAKRAAIYAGSWVDSNDISSASAEINQLQISVKGTTLTVQGTDLYDNTLAPSSGTFSGDPFSIELTSSYGDVYDLQISLNNSQGTELNVVVGSSPPFTMVKSRS